MTQTYQYNEFPGLEFDVELSPAQITALVETLNANFKPNPILLVKGWPEGKELAKAMEMLFAQLLKGKVHVANASATALAKMNAALVGAIQTALSAAWAKVQAITEKITEGFTMTVEALKGHFTFKDSQITGYLQPFKITVNGKIKVKSVKFDAAETTELFGALAEQTAELNSAMLSFGKITQDLDAKVFPDRKIKGAPSAIAWDVQQVEGVWQVEKTERAPSVTNGDKAQKGAPYEIVDPATTPESVYPIAETGQKAAFLAYAQRYPGSVNPETSLNLPKWSAGKLKANKPYIRIRK